MFSGNHGIAGLLIATSFAAGLNVYATLVTLGLLAHAGLLALPPSLQLLASWHVIAASFGLFAIEFFADKVPAFDLIWNALHTFIRIPIAALLAYRATAQLSPAEQRIRQDAAIEARDYQRQVSRAAAEKAVGELTSHGMQFNDVSAVERERMREIAKPVTDKALATYDPAIQKLFASEVERVQRLR